MCQFLGPPCIIISVSDSESICIVRRQLTPAGVLTSLSALVPFEQERF